MFRWATDGVLAGSHRPGYRGESGGQVSVETVDEWLDQLKAQGIGSIICLLNDDQLPYYSSLPNGLLNHYRAKGFNVRHVPAFDRRMPPLNESQLEDIWKSFNDLDKPVLIHCSAGMDRTGQALKYIQNRLDEISA